MKPLNSQISLAVVISLPVWLGACSFIPNTQLPKFETPETFRESRIATEGQAMSLWKAAGENVPAQSAPWELFGIPALPELLSRLESANANLALAKARYQQAGALIDQAHAGLFPTLNGNVNKSRSSASTTGTAVITETNNVALSSTWEIDLWGRLSATEVAAEASAKASLADYAGVRLALQAQLVQALLSLQVVDLQRQILEASVADYQRYVQLTSDRVRYGIASRADLAQAETQLRSAQAQSIDTGIQRATLEHAVAVLVGELPSTFQLNSLAADGKSLRAPLRHADEGFSPQTRLLAVATTHASVFDQLPAVPQVPLTAPSHLLERRPDVAAAERRVIAANAQVGVARSAFFPVLSLTASGGQRAAEWADIFKAPARVWSIGPAITAPLFDAGLRSSQKAQAVAAWEQATATYRQAVLTAFQEVEDQLATLRILEEETRAQSEAVSAARLSADLTLAQYRAGTAGGLQVIVANNALLTAERSALDLHNRRLAASVALIRGLGGGWVVNSNS